MTTESRQENTRIFSFDYLKTFCIFLVCFGHSLLYIFSEHNYNLPIVKYIYAFHMPLFMTISGFFFVSCFKKNFITVIREKSIQLLLPCLSFFLIIKLCRIDAYLNFWYLKCLFCLYIIYYLLFLIQRKMKIKTIIFWCIINSLFFIFAPFFNLSFIYTYKLMFMFPFFGLGIFIRTYWNFIRSHEKFFLVGSFVISLFAIFFWKTEYIIYFTPIKYFSLSGIDKHLLFASVFRWFTGGVLSIFFIILFDMLAKYLNSDNPFSKILTNIGTHSLNIYLLQSFILEYSFIDYKKIEMENINIYGGGLLFSIIAIFLSMLISYFIEKNKILNLLLFGRK